MKNPKFTKEEKSWIMYDWANSSYATIMMTVIFPIYFSGIAEKAGREGDYWWGIGTSIAMIIIAILAPFAGALSDFKGYKMKLFTAFLALGIGFTFLSAFSNSWVVLLCGYAVSHIGFSGSCLIYDSFLSDVTTSDKMDKVSGYGFAFGYIGGSTIPFLISIALITFGGNFGIETILATKISIIITAVWWLVFTIPFFKNIHQRYGLEKPKSSELLRETFSSILKTAKKIVQNKKILFFLLAYFFYIDGVGTVIKMSTSYGTALSINSTGMILALLVTQLVAFPCSIIFSNMTKRFGSLRMIKIAVCVYLFICIMGFVMGFGLEEAYFGVNTALVMFWILAIMVGTVQGGIQAVSRSFYCQIIPPENSGEFFGFYDIFGKFASVLGPLLYSVTKAITGRSSLSILSIIILFIVAIIFLSVGRKHFECS